MMSSQVFVVCLCLIAFASALDWLSLKPAQTVKIHKNITVAVSFGSYKTTWEIFKLQHGKKYIDDLEEEYRFNIFARNLKKIEEHNDLFLKGKKSYTLGMNQFADLRVEEFRKFNGLLQNTNVTTQGCSHFIPPNFLALPKSVDWRDKGAVTPVKNQGQCGSCWSFSTTGSMEGQYFRKTGDLKSFSEQQLVDCSAIYGDHGCQGGLMDFAFEYIRKYGIELETDYPYKAKQGHCHYNKTDVVTKDTGCEDVDHGNEADLKAAVASEGPISIAIDASHSSFQLYSEGVYDEPQCSSEQLDHGVLVVGYGSSDEGQDYWIVKNSWGKTWGKEGYIWMSRNKDNQCGIATQASFPLL